MISRYFFMASRRRATSKTSPGRFWLTELSLPAPYGPLQRDVKTFSWKFFGCVFTY